MSIERPDELTEKQAEALDLIKGTKLEGDEYTLRVIHSGRADSGVEVDLDTFLPLRELAIDSAVMAARVTAKMSENPDAWEVANSVKPDVEKYLD